MWVGLRGLRGWWHEGRDFDRSIVSHTYFSNLFFVFSFSEKSERSENLRRDLLPSRQRIDDNERRSSSFSENTLHSKEPTLISYLSTRPSFSSFTSCKQTRFQPSLECLPGPCLSLNYRQGLFHVGIPRATYLIALFRARTHTTGPTLKRRRSVNEGRWRRSSEARGKFEKLLSLLLPPFYLAWRGISRASSSSSSCCSSPSSPWSTRRRRRSFLSVYLSAERNPRQSRWLQFLWSPRRVFEFLNNSGSSGVGENGACAVGFWVIRAEFFGQAPVKNSARPCAPLVRCLNGLPL